MPDPRPDDAQIDGTVPDPLAGQALRVARDFLLDHREDYETAYRDFIAPRPETFNWAVDWFDGVLAVERPEQPALWLVGEDGTEARLTFAEMSATSSQVAAWLRGRGPSTAVTGRPHMSGRTCQKEFVVEDWIVDLIEGTRHRHDEVG